MENINKESIRLKAICLIRKKNEIFVGFGADPITKEEFYVPLGGGNELNERGDQAVIREFKEEADIDINNVKLIGVLENVFTFAGNPSHEILLVYEGDFIDKSIYERPEIVRYDDMGREKKALWKNISFFKEKKGTLYPDGLLELLIKKWGI